MWDGEIVAALIGVAATIIVATFGYAWQKSKDRNLAVELQKFKIYSEYLSAMGRYYQACLMPRTKGKETAWQAYIETHVPAAEMLVYVDRKMAFAARRWIEGIKAYQQATYNFPDEKENDIENWRSRRRAARDLATDARREFLGLVRSDLIGCTLDEASQVILAYHGSDTESLLDIEYDGLSREIAK